VAALQAMHRGAGVRTSLRRLAAQELVATDPDGRWRLTEVGAARARALVEGRT
jgi:Mn-dependent DtxR family transcriptional regulator